MRHPPEDHLVEQVPCLGEGFLSGFALAPAVRQVGEVDDEAAFLSRDQIDGPCRRIGRVSPPPPIAGRGSSNRVAHLGQAERHEILADDLKTAISSKN
jgi:hypothetical protein